MLHRWGIRELGKIMKRIGAGLAVVITCGVGVMAAAPAMAATQSRPYKNLVTS